MKDRHKPGSIDAYNAVTYDNVRLRVRKDSGIKQAIEDMAKHKNVSMQQYIIDAVVKQLQADVESLNPD